jgi:hypothetical protein
MPGESFQNHTRLVCVMVFMKYVLNPILSHVSYANCMRNLHMYGKNYGQLR